MQMVPACRKDQRNEKQLLFEKKNRKKNNINDHHEIDFPYFIFDLQVVLRKLL